MKNILYRSILIFLILTGLSFGQTELLTNVTFDDSLNSWELFPDQGAEATLDIDSTGLMDGKHSAHINITKMGSSGEYWEIGFYQAVAGGIVEGKKYQVKFQAKASANIHVDYLIQQLNSPWASLNTKTIEITTEVQTFEFTFIASVTEPECTWQFGLGASGISEIWIDDVHFYELEQEDGDLEVLNNNYFDKGLENWETWLDGGAEATVEIDTTGLLEGVNSVHIALTKSGSSGESWEFGFAQAIQGGIKAGKSYVVKYQAKSNVPVVIENIIQEANDPWTALYSGGLTLDVSPKSFVDTFNVTESAVCNWVFSLGAIDTAQVWIDDVHLIELENPTGISFNNNNNIPNTFVLEQNYPNPFNPTTTIKFGLAEQSNLKVEIFNILGKRVWVILNSQKSAGYHEIVWNAENFSSGVYIIRISAEGLESRHNFIKVKKATLLK